MSGMEGFITGLSNSLNSYLQLNQQQQRQRQQTQYENQLKTQSDIAKEGRELANQKELETYKTDMKPILTPEMADEAMPGLGSLVTKYNTDNPKSPLRLDEGTAYIRAALEKLTKHDSSEQNRKLRMDTTILNYTEKLEKNPTILEINKQGVSLDALDRIIDLSKNGNTVASAAMGTKMARAMGEVGVLTESDISRYVTSGRLDRKAGDTLSKWVAGKPSDATLDEIKQIGEVLKGSFGDKIQPIYDSYVNKLSKNMGISPEEAAERLDVPYAGSKKRGKVEGNTGNAEAAPIIHTYKSGRKAIYDPQTKTWSAYNG